MSKLKSTRTLFLTTVMILFFIFHSEISNSTYLTSNQVIELSKEAKEHNTFLTEVAILNEYIQAYEKLVDTIKWHEGYRAYPYYCMANVLTVGYGHTIKKGDSFTYPMSKETADSLLRADFDRAIDYVERTTELEHLQKLAIAHFVYALGSGRFSNSTLKSLIHNNRPIDHEIIKWINIRTSNGIVQSEHLKRSRVMELNLYNS